MMQTSFNDSIKNGELRMEKENFDIENCIIFYDLSNFHKY